MQFQKIVAVLLLCSVAYVHCQQNAFAMNAAGNAANSGAPVGKPQFTLEGAGSGNNRRNWNAGGNAGLGAKVFQSQNGRHSVGAAVTGGRAFGRHEGQSWRSKPQYGAGVGYTYKFGGGRRG